jgi:hypothetical protein
MPLIRVKYHSGLEAEYLTEGQDYYINWNPNWRKYASKYLPSHTYFTSSERRSGTFVDTCKVEIALETGGLEIIRGLPKPKHVEV